MGLVNLTVKAIDILRPILLVFPRPSMRILGYLGAGFAQDAQWKSVKPRYVSYFDRHLQCIMTADRTEWGGRKSYYWGRYYDLTLQSIFRKFVTPGATFIDIGANLGYHSLYAARLVGAEGMVLSFEPNPSTYSILTGHIAINRIRNCKAYEIALSDVSEEQELVQQDDHSGTATLRPLKQAAHTAKVLVRTGDETLHGIPFSGRVLMKIDVEGYELRVLRGLKETLRRVDVVTVEITPEWISNLGGYVTDLYGFMREMGFYAFIPELRWTAKLFFPELMLIPGENTTSKQHDSVFIRAPILEEMNIKTE